MTGLTTSARTWGGAARLRASITAHGTALPGRPSWFEVEISNPTAETVILDFQRVVHSEFSVESDDGGGSHASVGGGPHDIRSGTRYCPREQSLVLIKPRTSLSRLVKLTVPSDLHGSGQLTADLRFVRSQASLDCAPAEIVDVRASGFLQIP